jgi:Dyp-type peroxidase family
MDRHGVRTVHHQELHALPNRREHFGWADGFGQPAVEGYPPDDDEDDPRPEAGGRAPAKRPGQGVPLEDGSWRDLKAGEFILGHPDEDGQVLAGPATPLLRNGSFMVWRKLRQDVPLFRAGLQEEARRYGRTIGSPLGDDELYEVLAAKLVGRWRDGVAIEVVPERSGPDLRDLGDRADPDPDNDFVYTSDPDGFTCPRGAHIRRTNPRGVKGWGGTMATRHRIIRRGMPYGPPLEPGDEDEQERGLVFICFNADLERQFEIVQAQWCNDGNAFGLGNDKDYLLGDDQGTAKVTVEGTPPYFARAQPRIVLTRGCEYLLMPGINALRDLVEPRPGLVRR